MSVDYTAAAEALAAANDEQVAPVVEAAEQAPVEAVDPSTDDGGNTPVVNEDSFTDIDLSDLSPEVQAAAEQIKKQLQADYTRKTQEIAPFRKLGVDADVARQAVEFVQRLDDPDFQRQLYDRLSSEFGSDEVITDEDDPGYVDPRDRQIQDVTKRMEAFEQKVIRSEIKAELDRQEAIVRTNNPTWGDEELRDVAKFALAHDGDLVKGAEELKSLTQRAISAHLKQKESVSAVAHVSASGNAEVPSTVPKTTDEAFAAAMSRLKAEGLA